MSFGIWQRTITDDAGNVLPGASIEVREPSSDFTGALVFLFSNEAGSTGLANPFNADSEGFAQLYAAPRKVDIRATGSGSQRTWRNVEILGTAAIQDTSRFPYVVGSVAELHKGGFPAEVNSIKLLGYYGEDTAGGGPLYRDSADTTTADNGGTVFVDADGVRWKRPKANKFDIQEFGAEHDVSFDFPSTLTTNAAIVISKGFKLRLEPLSTIEIENISISGGGEIVSNNSTTPIFNFSGDLSLDNIQLSGVGEFLRSSAGFNRLAVVGCIAVGFGRFAYITGESQRNVLFRDNTFIGVPDWGINTVAPERACAVYYTTQTVDFGEAFFHNNRVFNIVSENDSRADAILTRVRNFVATGNTIQNVLGNRADYISKGYLDYASETSSTGLYSSSKKTVWTDNILRNCGRATMNTTSIDALIVENNVIEFDIESLPSGTPTLGGDFYQWSLHGLYNRALSSKVSNNKFFNMPWDILAYTTSASEVVEDRLFSCVGNTFKKSKLPSGLYGAVSNKNIYCHKLPKNIHVEGNVFDGLDGSHPVDFQAGRSGNLYILPNDNFDLSSVVFSMNKVSNMEISGSPTLNASITIDNPANAGLGFEKVVGVSILSNNYLSQSQFDYGLSCLPALQDAQLKDMMSESGSGFDPMHFTRPASFSLLSVDGCPEAGVPFNRFVENYVNVTIPDGQSSANFSWTRSIFSGRVDIDVEYCSVMPRTDLKGASNIWLSNLTSSGGTLNVDVNAADNIFNVRVGVNLSGVRVSSN